MHLHLPWCKVSKSHFVEADLEEDRSEEIAPNSCQDQRHKSQPEKQLGHGS